MEREELEKLSYQEVQKVAKDQGVAEYYEKDKATLINEILGQGGGPSPREDRPSI